MEKEFLKGKRGVLLVDDKNETITKRLNPRSTAKNALLFEAKFLKLLNKHKIGPKLKKASEQEVVMEFIDGVRIENYLKEASSKQCIKILKDIFRQLRILDRLGINKYELRNPYKHIIVRKHKAVMIDFERCRFTENPKNISQFCQFVRSKKIQDALHGKVETPSNLLLLAQTYRKDTSTKNYNALVRWLHEV